MTIKACKNWAILSYEKEEDYTETKSGLLLMSKRNQRAFIKNTTHTLGSDPDVELPDVIRLGKVLDAEGFTKGQQVLFNKHDGWGFTLDEEYLYVVPTEKIMGIVT